MAGAAQVCENIQMLLEAAEFLERRERGRPPREQSASGREATAAFPVAPRPSPGGGREGGKGGAARPALPAPPPDVVAAPAGAQRQLRGARGPETKETRLTNRRACRFFSTEAEHGYASLLPYSAKEREASKRRSRPKKGGGGGGSRSGWCCFVRPSPPFPTPDSRRRTRQASPSPPVPPSPSPSPPAPEKRVGRSAGQSRPAVIVPKAGPPRPELAVPRFRPDLRGQVPAVSQEALRKPGGLPSPLLPPPVLSVGGAGPERP